jgi:single-strand DNA-binding protein
MSRSVNKVILIGNVGGDPEVRSTSGGRRVANFSLATSRQWSSASGEKQEQTQWHKCVAWNQGSKGTGLADVVEKYVGKGDKVYLEGRIEYRSFEDRDKQVRYVTEILVTELVMLGSKREDAGAKPAASKSASAGGSEFPETLDGGDDDLPF